MIALEQSAVGMETTTSVRVYVAGEQTTSLQAVQNMPADPQATSLWCTAFEVISLEYPLSEAFYEQPGEADALLLVLLASGDNCCATSRRSIAIWAGATARSRATASPGLWGWGRPGMRFR